MVIGIFGTIGSGKSTVAKIIKKYFNFFILDCDQLGHEVIELPSVKKELSASFGDKICTENGKISREILSQIIFHDQEHKNKLESILWPKMTNKIQEIIQDHTNIVLDAAVLYQAKWNRFCSFTIYVQTSIERVLAFQSALDNLNHSEYQVCIDVYFVTDS